MSALNKGFIREEDTTIIFHDLTFLAEKVDHLKSLFPSNTLHGIAIKANPLIHILEYLQPMGTGIEAATAGEVYLALKTGYAPRNIVYDSPVKTHQEIEFALRSGVHINIDNLTELERIAKLKNKILSTSTFGIRINPQVGTGTILESSVAGDYSKFGVPIKSGREQLIEAFNRYNWLTGVHLHVGSQGCKMDLLIRGIDVLYDFVKEVNEKAGHRQICIFDIGGGLPVSYDRSSAPVSMEEYANAIKNNFPGLIDSTGNRETRNEFREPRTENREPGQLRLITEFGRWIHVNAGWVACRVEYVKHDPPVNTAMIHAGADLFLRECLNPKDWHHEYSLMDKNGKLKSQDIRKSEIGNRKFYNLAGPLCFSGDILARNVELPEVEEGDYIIIHDTGGYTFSMWSRYNSRQTPRILGYFNDGEQFDILKERETYDDIYNFWK